MNTLPLFIFLKGLVTGVALIIPIGPQNAFVLRQGILKNYRILTAGICALCDCFLFTLGIGGVGAFITSSKTLMSIACWGGAAFVAFMAFLSFRRAFGLKGSSIDIDSIQRPTLTASIITILGVTLLNPHAYLDAIVLVGTFGSQFGDDRMIFAYGAMAASILWFFTLCFAGTALAPVFRNKRAWLILEIIIGSIMLWIAFSLVKFGLSN